MTAAASQSPLAAKLRARIAADGPLTVADYMDACLYDPQWGYYAGTERHHAGPFGRAGDFTTSPEISQVFGELIGLWALDCWRQLGFEEPVRLVELGPGRGTLMADAVRAIANIDAGKLPDIHLIETSRVLRADQAAALSGHAPQWHDTVADLPSAPAIFVANELFDALPVRQFFRVTTGDTLEWRERMITVDADDGSFCFCDGLAPRSEELPQDISDLTDRIGDGELVTICGPGDDIMREICRHLGRHGGAGLVIDYGYAAGPGYSPVGDTLQAVARHRFVDPLATPGDCDLTAHVDFAALAATARRCGATVWGPVNQGIFLKRLGIEVRAAQLSETASAADRQDIDAAIARLTSDESMGRLFKVFGLTHDAPGHTPVCPSGFDRPGS